MHYPLSLFSTFKGLKEYTILSSLPNLLVFSVNTTLIQKVNPSMDRISSKCIDEFKVPYIEIDPYCKISFQFQFKMNSIIKFLYTSIWQNCACNIEIRKGNAEESAGKFLQNGKILLSL